MKFKVGTNSFELAGIFLKVETKKPHLFKLWLVILFAVVAIYVNWC